MAHVSGASSQPLRTIGGAAQIGEYRANRAAELEQLLLAGAEGGDPQQIALLRAEHFREYLEVSRATSREVPRSVRQTYGMDPALELDSDSFVQSASRGPRVLLTAASTAFDGHGLRRLGEEIEKIPLGVGVILDLVQATGLPERVRDVFLGTLLKRVSDGSPVWIITNDKVRDDFRMRKLDLVFNVVDSEAAIK
ncbi:MAG: hypothetical protein K1X83_00345 [Oligoflexia bacterium]|nr:hypothetical protein [Oligoflexia bacterium]